MSRKSLLQKARELPAFAGIVGESPALLECLYVAWRAAQRPAHLLVTGEEGTGKEGLAMGYARQLGRRIVPVNCATLAEGTADAHIFGYAKGAFTGATKDAKGLVHEAEGAVLFLDEFADLPGAVQAKMLRLVQFGEVRRLGATKVERVDLVIVAATNRPLGELVRSDLVSRFPERCHLPPLRERGDDVRKLAAILSDKLQAAKPAAERVRLSPGAVAALASMDWPGNVRDLEHALGRLLGDAILMGHTEIHEVDVTLQPGCATGLQGGLHDGGNGWLSVNEWAGERGISRQSAWRWCQRGHAAGRLEKDEQGRYRPAQ